MGSRHGHGALSRKVESAKVYPKIYINRDEDYASIKIAAGVEKKSYVKDGFVFCENSAGKVIEIQILNLSALKK